MAGEGLAPPGPKYISNGSSQQYSCFIVSLQYQVINPPTHIPQRQTVLQRAPWELPVCVASLIG